jgi:GT2 family glycosyltransferase
MKKIAVLFVLYNDENNIPTVIQSLKDQTYSNYEVYAIETSKSGNSIKLLSQLYPTAHCFDYKGNLGFAAGNNYLADIAIKDGVDFLFILNADMELSNNTFEVFLDYFNNNVNLGVIGAVLLYGGSRLKEKTIQLFGVNANFRTQNNKHLFANVSFDNNHLPKEIQVDIVNGGSTFLSKEVYFNVGLFEPDFFMYNDEIDFAFRVKEAGFKTLVTSKTTIIHHHNWDKTNSIGYYRMYYYMMRNRNLFYYKRKAYVALILENLKGIILFPFVIKFCLKRANIRLMKYYYLGSLHGLLNKKGISCVRFD